MTSTQTSDPTTAKRRPIGFVIAVLMLVAIVSSFESTMMYTALPGLITEFDSTESAVSWVLTGFLLVGAASAAISGRLGDIFGRKRVLVILLVASIAGSVISLLAADISGVIIGRAVQGLAGGLLPLCFGIIREAVAAKSLTVAVSLVAGTAMLAGAAGNIIAGVIIDSAGWRYIFVAAIAMTVVTVVGALFLHGSTPEGPRDRIDWLGGILFAPGLALVLFGINAAHGLGWVSPVVLGCIGLGVLVLVGWYFWERRHATPMVNVRLFSQRNLGLTMLAAALLGIPMGMAGYLGQLIMQYPTEAPVGFGLAAAAAGAVSFAIGLFGFALSPLSGRIARNGRARISLMIGAGAGVLAAVLTALGAAVMHSFPMFIVSQVVLTVSTAFVLSALPMLVVESSPAKNTSEATGMYTVIQTAFSGVGTSLSTSIMAGYIAEGSHFSSEAGYIAVFTLIAVLSLAAFVIAALLRTPKGAASQVRAGEEAAVIVPVH
ncbi:MFS transporter [Agromyces seonyuensis]|uniref:MFS transporter n=1 Tax=Agromyces seonyuensis TaxID=2662446 RepID=A0A6I4NTY5_9MICO|nr:MFS transporter [Agromyces seonyuensis]MWB97561.1 MFS transporter [Agromyces seonyuensis]